MKLSKTQLVGIFAAVAVSNLAVSSPAKAAPSMLPNLGPEFSEGTEVYLTPSELSELGTWAYNSKNMLEDLLKTVTKLSSLEVQKKRLLDGITQVVPTSNNKRTELLMRYVLNRSLALVAEIEKYLTLYPGTGRLTAAQHSLIEQQVRIMKRSIGLAKTYYQDDLAALENSQKEGKSILAPQYAKFGTEYVQWLMKMNESIFNVRAQYSIAMHALGWWQRDLFRKEDERLKFAPAIRKLNDFIQASPPMESLSDPELIERMRMIRDVYYRTLDLLAQYRLAEDRATLEYVDLHSLFKKGERVMIEDKDHFIGEIYELFDNNMATLDFGNGTEYVRISLKMLVKQAVDDCYQDPLGSSVRICKGTRITEKSTNKTGKVLEVFQNGWVRLQFDGSNNKYVKHHANDLSVATK